MEKERAPDPVRLAVAVHKPYPIPEDPLYFPVQAGAALHDRLPFQGDDTGDQISARNDLYCELTVLYWAWKNLPAEALGLCHYRRYFQEPGQKCPLTLASARAVLSRTPVILPKKRNYWIETGESQFVHAHGAASLEALRSVLRDGFPEYLPAFDRSMSRTSGHRFNMLLMRRDLLDDYCSWLFAVLFKTEKRLNPPPARIMGFLSERLLDAWVETKQLPCAELPVYYTERTNWVRKGGIFLMRKFRGSIYPR